MGRTPYKWFNINIIGPGKRINGKSGKGKTTIFWPYYSGKCRTVGTYSPRRNHGRATASRQTEKTVDTRHWRVNWLQIHSAKKDVTRSSTIEKKRYRSGRLLSPTLIEEGRLVSECNTKLHNIKQMKDITMQIIIKESIIHDTVYVQVAEV